MFCFLVSMPHVFVFAVIYWFDKEFLYLAFRSHVPFPESWGHNCRFYFPIIRPHVLQNLNKHFGDKVLVHFKQFFKRMEWTIFIGFGKVLLFLQRKILCQERFFGKRLQLLHFMVWQKWKQYLLRRSPVKKVVSTYRDLVMQCVSGSGSLFRHYPRLPLFYPLDPLPAKWAVACSPTSPSPRYCPPISLLI